MARDSDERLPAYEPSSFSIREGEAEGERQKERLDQDPDSDRQQSRVATINSFMTCLRAVEQAKWLVKPDSRRLDKSLAAPIPELSISTWAIQIGFDTFVLLAYFVGDPRHEELGKRPLMTSATYTLHTAVHLSPSLFAVAGS